jgi:U-box domain
MYTFPILVKGKFMVRLTRAEIPIEEPLFQFLLAEGIIKQCPSKNIENDPDETPSFEIQQFFINELLRLAKFDPKFAKFGDIYKLDCKFTHLTNQVSSEINISQSGTYEKVLHHGLFTEVGFYFKSNSLDSLENNLKNANVVVNKNQDMVNIPFFMARWSENHDQYEYHYPSMENFYRWLKMHFSHCNISDELSQLTKKFLEVANQFDYKKRLINGAQVILAINNLLSKVGFCANAKSEIEMPRSFICPISLKTMENPVLCTLDGISYEEREIREWLKKNRSSPLTSQTMTLLTSIDDILHKNSALKEAIKVGLYPNAQSEREIPQSFICPISRETMENPVLCTLDGISYEEREIRKWLEENGTTPFTRQSMIPGTSIDDVLQKNITLKEAIEEFKTKYPALFQEDCSSLSM